MLFNGHKGMCCSFNMKAADDIYLGESYPQLLTRLQESDKNASFSNSIVPDWYEKKSEPKTLPGRNKGLVLILDAHTNLFAAGSLGKSHT